MSDPQKCLEIKNLRKTRNVKIEVQFWSMIGLTALLANLSELAKISINFRFCHFPLLESSISELAFYIIIRALMWLLTFQKYWIVFMISNFATFTIKCRLLHQTLSSSIFGVQNTTWYTYEDEVADLFSIFSFLLFQFSDSTICSTTMRVKMSQA